MSAPTAYTVPPFSQRGRITHLSEARARAIARARGGDPAPCAICGSYVLDPGGPWAVVVDGGAAWGDRDSDPTDPGYLGAFPVGARCHRKYAVRSARPAARAAKGA